MKNSFGENEKLNEASYQKAFYESSEEAERLLEDIDKTEIFLEKVEEKLREVKGIGKGLTKIPVMIQLIRSYIKKEYTDIPIGSIIGITGALIYFFSPVDLIPDIIPVIGLLDDMTVIGIALKLVAADLECYEEWRNNTKQIETYRVCKGDSE